MNSSSNYTPLVQAMHDVLPRTQPETPDRTLTENLNQVDSPEDAFHLARAISELIAVCEHFRAISILTNRSPQYPIFNKDDICSSRAVTVHLHKAQAGIKTALGALKALERSSPVVPTVESGTARHTSVKLLASIGGRLHEYIIESEAKPIALHEEKIPEAKILDTKSLDAEYRDTERVIVSTNHLFAKVTGHHVTSSQTLPEPLPGSIDIDQPLETDSSDLLADSNSPFLISRRP